MVLIIYPLCLDGGDEEGREVNELGRVQKYQMRRRKGRRRPFMCVCLG